MQKIVAKKMALGGGRMHSCFLSANTFLCCQQILSDTPPRLNLFTTAVVSSCHFPIKECVYWLHCLALNSRLKIVNNLVSHLHACCNYDIRLCAKLNPRVCWLHCLALNSRLYNQTSQYKKNYGIAMSPPSKLLINCVCLLTFAIFHSKYRHYSVLCRVLFVRHFELIPIISTLHYTTLQS